MKINIRLSILLLFASLAFAGMAQKNEGGAGLHVFGVGMSLSDSTVYLSQPQFLGQATLQPKTGFMDNRASYAFQMKTYLEANYVGYETCAVFFAKSQKKALKKYQKVMRQSRKKGLHIVELPESEFTFKYIPLQSSQTVTNVNSTTPSK